jgi:hypothetical protein
MKTIKVAEATNAQLNWMVGVAQGCYDLSLYGVDPSIRAWKRGLGVTAPYSPTTNWSQMGPIIERERIQLRSEQNIQYRAFTGLYGAEGVGPTHLIAAARCYVASKLGDEVEVPDALA